MLKYLFDSHFGKDCKFGKSPEPADTLDTEILHNGFHKFLWSYYSIEHKGSTKT